MRIRKRNKNWDLRIRLEYNDSSGAGLPGRGSETNKNENNTKFIVNRIQHNQPDIKATTTIQVTNCWLLLFSSQCHTV